jgi:hypothetical protein
MSTRREKICWVVLIAATACGGPPPAPDLDAAFRRIQVHEARIAHRSAAAAACHAPCPAAREVCESADAICAIAEEVHDSDARTRCEMARRDCPPWAR